MNGSYNVAEKVLDYWFTIEFLAQDKFPVQGLDSKKAIKEAKEGESKRKTLSHFLLFDNNTVDTVYETIISEVEKCGMKCWSNLTFYLGKVKRKEFNFCGRIITRLDSLFLKGEQNYERKA